jgi:ElaB/YqjD/DUF883 family membrane-anchored ribosome-binding protein
MPDTSENPGSRYRHHDATPGSGPDRSARTAAPDSFPASDPLASTAAVGTRAVDPAELMAREGGSGTVGGAAMVVARFPDQEAAKLALERLVREVPLDRRAATLRSGDGGVVLELAVAEADAARVGGMLRGCGGQDAPGRAGDAARDLGEDARQEIARLRARIEQLTRERIAPAAAGTARAARAYAQGARERVAGQADRAAALVRERPLATLAVMAAVAFLLGRLSGGRDRRR